MADGLPLNGELLRNVAAWSQRSTYTTGHDLDRIRRAFNWIQKNGVI
jgi:hypothetical protein